MPFPFTELYTDFKNKKLTARIQELSTGKSNSPAYNPKKFYKFN